MDKQREFVKADCMESSTGSVPFRKVDSTIRDIIKTKVKNFLEEKKVYLDPKMSLQKFSAITSTNTTYLSNTVNDCFGCSFRTLLNRYRVQHAIDLMTNEGGQVDEIYKKSGFASRSAFYASFKLVTDQTPLQYAKRLALENDVYWT